MFKYQQYTKLEISDEEQKQYKEKMNLCYVAFVDILGFKEMAKNEFDKVILALRKIKMFSEEYYSNVNGVRFLSEIEKEWEEEDIDFLLPKATMFSDSIVISAQVGSTYLGDFINSLGQLQCDLLLNGITIRGGVEVGYIYQDEFMVFGDGLISAYTLESEIAKYPRIVVGKKAQQRTVEAYDRQFEYWIDEAIENHYPEECQSNLYDNYYTADALGNITHERDAPYIDYLAGYLDWDADYFVKNFVKIKEVILEGLQNEDKKVRDKYDWLKEYYDWTIERRINLFKEEQKNDEADLLTKLKI